MNRQQLLRFLVFLLFQISDIEICDKNFLFPWLVCVKTPSSFHFWFITPFVYNTTLNSNPLGKNSPLSVTAQHRYEHFVKHNRIHFLLFQLVLINRCRMSVSKPIYVFASSSRSMTFRMKQRNGGWQFRMFEEASFRNP